MAAANSSSQTVFVGGDVGFNDLSNLANTVLLRATGDVGLYTQEDAVSLALGNGTLAGIVQGMAGTGPGETELNLQSASGIVAWFTLWWVTAWLDYGIAPAKINSIVNFGSPTWKSDFYATVDAAKSYGITSVAPIFSPNGAGASLDTFSTNATYADIRAAAIYGGALAIDAPPNFFLRNTAAYQQFTYQEIQWAHQNGLRVTVIISPSNDDSEFLNDTEDFVSALQANNAIPTEWVVENYDPSDTDGVGSDTNPNSIAGVALWVAQNASTNASGASTPIVTPSITISAPGTIAETIYGAGVTVTETITTTDVPGPIYVAVFTSAGVMESPAFTPVTLNSSNQGTFTVTLAHDGDYVVAESRLFNPTSYVYSAPVKITEAIPQSITVSAPGTAAEAALGAGVTVKETITATNLPGQMYAAVVSSAGLVEGAGYVPVTMAATSQSLVTQATQAFTFLNSGDHLSVKSAVAWPFIFKDSSTVAITEAIAQSITVSAPGTAAEAALGAGVTVNETITATNLPGQMYAAVVSSTGVVEGAGYVPVTMTATGQTAVTQATQAFTFLNSGDHLSVKSAVAWPFIFKDSSTVAITHPAATNGSKVATITTAAATPTFLASTTSAGSTTASLSTVATSVTGSTNAVANDMSASAGASGSSSQVVALPEAVPTATTLSLVGSSYHPLIVSHSTSTL